MELITVINNPINISLYRGTSPPDTEDGDGRKISDGPLYAPATINSIASNNKFQFWSNGAITDQRKWMLTVEYAAYLVQEAMKHGKFRNSEWCLAKPGGPWAACDVYLVTVKEWIKASNKEMAITYYLKFAISKTGQMLLSASNHPERT